MYIGDNYSFRTRRLFLQCLYHALYGTERPLYIVLTELRKHLVLGRFSIPIEPWYELLYAVTHCLFYIRRYLLALSARCRLTTFSTENICLISESSEHHLCRNCGRTVPINLCACMVSILFWFTFINAQNLNPSQDFTSRCWNHQVFYIPGLLISDSSLHVSGYMPSIPESAFPSRQPSELPFK